MHKARCSPEPLFAGNALLTQRAFPFCDLCFSEATPKSGSGEGAFMAKTL